jgi:hypothetical protein
MNAQASFALRGRNPDVLTCIANLSNDEVFTPPEFANRMLDTLAEAWAATSGGANIWTDKTVFYPSRNPACFCEIQPLWDWREIPELEKRVNHILTKQVFGIGITHFTACSHGAACIAQSTRPVLHRERLQRRWKSGLTTKHHGRKAGAATAGSEKLTVGWV